MTDNEPIFDVAQLSHVELFTPKMDESLWFFKELLGLQESSRDGKSVYLRGYEESYHHSLKLTERDQPGMAQMGWRASSKLALDRRVSQLENTVDQPATKTTAFWRSGSSFGSRQSNVFRRGPHAAILPRSHGYTAPRNYYSRWR